MKQFIYAKVIGNKQISKQGIFQLVINCKQNIVPGQFFNFYIEDKSLLLPRPISVCEITPELTKFVYHIVGSGTEKLAQVKEGDWIKILGPLGNGFTIPPQGSSIIIVGGGMGIAPLLEVAKRTTGEKYVYLGFTESPFLLEKFSKYSENLHYSTVSGEEGFHGNVIDLLRNYPVEAQYVYACGPKQMLKTLIGEESLKGAKIELSMEERMGCGIGACLGCGIKIKKINQKEWKYLRVCKDGPVFDGNEVVWDEN